MTRRGRPRKKRPAFDTGTPELIAKRLAISPDDPTLATTPLDALKARGVIPPEAHSAAVHFLACRALVFGNPHPQAVDPSRVTGPESMAGSDARAEEAYREACHALNRQGRRVFDAIENIVVHERWPDWFYKHVPHRRAKQHAMTGFAVLLGWDQGMKRAAE